MEAASAAPVAASAPDRDLGPDPGADGYRTLNLCALVTPRELEPAFHKEGGTGKVIGEVGGPGACDYRHENDKGTRARMEFADPRAEMPVDVRTTDPGTNKVDSSDAGVLVHDAAVAVVHVLSKSGYIVKVTGPGDTVDAQRLTLALSKKVRERLGADAPLPRLEVPDTALSRQDICAAAKEADVMGALRVTGSVKSSVDGRVCEFPDGFWVSFSVMGNLPATTSSAGELHIAGKAAQVTSNCEILVPLRRAPKGSWWEQDSLFAGAKDESPAACDRLIRALDPLVTHLTG
ncbi:hypothetical protein N802_10655 [Knoellia sinensis KCTC 19936]|uniref:DUF3558 domain-containing protein n=1 Tax=Knoellia sinensis KCTC 19936 TaxID=1385520 RepID=A0A0A0J479_9MICO|nr:hypothetical protein N802_10655 [Knoellia sinensis KCTC 19936]